MTDELCPPRAPGSDPLVWRFLPVPAELGPQCSPREEPPLPGNGSHVAVAWSPEGLHFHARLADVHVTTRARAHGERLWELGDVLEVFIGQAGSDPYLELQVAPNGCTLQLVWPSVATVSGLRSRGSRVLAPFLRSEPLFAAEPRVRGAGWEVEGLLPGAALSAHLAAPFGAGTRWDLSFAGYDYGAGTDSPVLFSTSALGAVDFHRRTDWRTIRLDGGFP